MSIYHPRIEPDDDGVIVDGVLYTDLLTAIIEHTDHSAKIIRNFKLTLRHRKQPKQPKEIHDR